MTKLLTELGLDGGIGIVAGLLLATWVEPATAEGVALVVFIGAIAVASALRSLRFALRRSAVSKQKRAASTPPNPLEAEAVGTDRDVSPGTSPPGARNAARESVPDDADEPSGRSIPGRAKKPEEAVREED